MIHYIPSEDRRPPGLQGSRVSWSFMQHGLAKTVLDRNYQPTRIGQTWRRLGGVVETGSIHQADGINCKCDINRTSNCVCLPFNLGGGVRAVRGTGCGSVADARALPLTLARFIARLRSSECPLLACVTFIGERAA